MATYFGTSINESPTVVYPAGEALNDARGIAVALQSNGTVKKAGAGANVLGIAIIETDDSVAIGDDVDVQIKDIGKWVAGAAITPGAELASDANGKAIPASSGDFIVGVALSGATKAGTWVKVQINKSGYKA